MDGIPIMYCIFIRSVTAVPAGITVYLEVFPASVEI